MKAAAARVSGFEYELPGKRLLNAQVPLIRCRVQVLTVQPNDSVAQESTQPKRVSGRTNKTSGKGVREIIRGRQTINRPHPRRGTLITADRNGVAVEGVGSRCTVENPEAAADNSLRL